MLFTTIASSYAYLFFYLGYASYLANIQVEAAYTNSILNTFTHLLLAQMEAKLPKHITNASCNDSRRVKVQC